MRVALVHDYLIQYGGAERVLEVLLELFPKAHLYTLLYSRERTRGRFHHNLYKTSVLDNPVARRNHRLFIPLMPFAMRSLRLKGPYDLILSDSAGFAKGLPNPGNVFHLSYCHTPLRYAWETTRYFQSPVFTWAFEPAFAYLRRWDREAGLRPDVMLAVSQYIAHKIRRYYGRTSEVLHPPVDYSLFYPDRRRAPIVPDEPYYFAVGRLLPYKRFGLLVDTFHRIGKRLVIAGGGPEAGRIRMRCRSEPAITFADCVTDEELRSLYSHARAVLFPQVEDFGLVACEALACGTPVIAFRAGGAVEIVEDGVTGVFFEDQTVDSLAASIQAFESERFDRTEIARRSRRFTPERFKAEILRHVHGSRPEQSAAALS